MGTMHTSDHRRSVWYFTPSCEVLGRLLEKKKEEDHEKNSDFAYERFLVWRRFVMTRKVFPMARERSVSAMSVRFWSSVSRFVVS